MAVNLRTLFFAGTGALVVAALAYVAFRTDPVQVDLHDVGRGPMLVTVNADGKTRISEIYEVAAPISGTARRAPVEVGDPVVAGETVVAVVEPAASGLLDTRTRIQAEAAVREAEAGLYVARSQLRQAEEDLAYAQSQHDRARTLVDRGVAPQSQLEDAEQLLGVKQAAAEAAVSRLEVAKSALDRARAALIEPVSNGAGPDEDCCVRITAPADGRVLDVDVVSERPVAAGTRLLSIGQPNDLEIVADLLSSDAVGLEPGARAIVERWGGALPLEARLSRIDPSAYTKVSALGIEEQRVDAVFDIVTPVEERPGLGDGFAVYLRIVRWEAEDVLRVPLSAIFRRGGNWAVFVVRDGRAEFRPVEIGHRNDHVAEVLGGLEPGELVITHPSDQVADGVAVIQREEAGG